MSTLVFEDYLEPVKLYLARYREIKFMKHNVNAVSLQWCDAFMQKQKASQQNFILRKPETETLLCNEAQVTHQQETNMIRSSTTPAVLPTIPGRWCFTDGSWKDMENFSGQGWYSTLEGFDGLMGARNTRASQSPLHSEFEALLWAMECMRNLRQYSVTFATDCAQLVKIVSEPDEWPAFANYLEDMKILKESFIHSEIIHISRTQNTRADSLARSARKQPTFIVHMDTEFPFWFTEFI